MPKPKINLPVLKRNLFERVHNTGELCNNDLPNILRVVIHEEAWRQDVDAEGKPFPNIEKWLHYHWPSGLSVGCNSIAMTYAQLMAHCEGHKDVWDVLVRHAPKGKRGGDRRSENAREDQKGEPPFDRNGTHKNKAVLAVRLQEKHPEHYEKYLRGEHKSITAAAVASGLVKEKTPLIRLKQYWKNASALEKKEFLAWIAEQESA